MRRCNCKCAPIRYLAADTHFEVAQLLAAQDTGQRPLLQRQYLTVQSHQFKGVGEFGHRVTDFLEAGVSVHFHGGLVPGQKMTVQGGDDHSLGEVVENCLKLSLALTQGLLGPLALGDVPYYQGGYCP